MLALWNPFNELESFEERVNRIFGEDFFPASRRESFSGWLPRVDVKEGEKEFVVTAELPGVSQKDVSIELKDSVLTIKGEKKVEEEEKNEKYHKVERCYGSFSRSFYVSDRIDEKKIEAKYKEGVLTLVLPKKEEAKPKKIAIKS